MTHRLPHALIAILLLLAALLPGCAQKGLLTEHYEPDELAVPRLLPNDTSQLNPTFLVIGDEQMGRRAIEGFYRKENWATWWQLAFPFYQTYLLYNGISGGINYLRHVPDAGQDSWLMMRDVLYRDVQRHNADFILNTGDIASANGEYLSHWERFLEGKKWTHPFLDDIAYVPTIGNHEWANDTTYGWPNYQAVFDYPRFYTLEFKHAALIVLDSNLLIDQWELIPTDEQEKLWSEWFVSEDGTSWLESQLVRYSDKPHLIVSMHHPPVSFGWHEYDWGEENYGHDLSTKRVKLIELLREHQVRVVFSGHEHIYQRTPTELAGEGADTVPTQFITSSGGGVPIRSAPPGDDVLELRDRYREDGLITHTPRILGEYHYVKVSMDADSLYLATYRVDDDDDRHPVSIWDRVTVPARSQ